MPSISTSISLSGLMAAGRNLSVGGNNIANSLSEGFKKRRTVHSDVAGGGVATSIQQINTAGPTVVDQATGEKRELSNTDSAEEMVNMIQSLRSAEANLKAIGADDEIIGTTIDLVT